MSKGDINAFLRKLFSSEGGGNSKVANQYGYIGKYQFGEDALIDLGYYKKDGTRNRNAAGKFEYDWVGEWTGKHGVYSRSDFLNNEAVQDAAAREWVALLCKQMKHFKLQSYIGRTIKGVVITESGLIAAAHLKGYGNNKSPGVIQFLKSNGEIDPTDTNKTHVSLYMKKFADYDLGCCGSVTAVLIDKDKSPISGLRYQIKVGSRTIEGKTDANGATQKIEGIDQGSYVSILVRRLEGGYKEIKSFFLKEQSAFIATLRSAKRMVTTSLEMHSGPPGDYKRQSENSAKKNADSTPPAAQQMAKPAQKKGPDDTNTIKQPTSSSIGSNNTEKTIGSSNIHFPSAQQTQISARDASEANKAISSQGADESGGAFDLQSNNADSRSRANIIQSRSAETLITNEENPRLAEEISLAEVMKEVGMDISEGEEKEDGKSYVESAAMPLEQRVLVEPQRNEDGHPVAVAKPNTASVTITPSLQKLEEILMRNVNSGRKKQTLSGPVAAEKSKRGEPISPYEKRADQSLGQCYKYVKIALLASGMTRHYLGQEAAKNAGQELEKEGYRNFLDSENHGLKNPYDAPVGAVIVYDVTDGTSWGHIEVRVSGGFASDYFSERPRTSPRNEKKQDAALAGRNRKVSGIWIKE